MVNKQDPANRPDRRSIRLKHYDYSYPGYYFVTICTGDKKTFFGTITDGRVVLSDLGKTADKCFIDIPNHFRDATIDQYVIMPNHVHGIIVIQSVGAAYMPPAKSSPGAQLPSTPGLLSEIVQQYESAVSRWCGGTGYHGFSWQRGFYEHVIRNENDMNDIRNYIVNNPLKWMDDSEYIS